MSRLFRLRSIFALVVLTIAPFTSGAAQTPPAVTVAPPVLSTSGQGEAKVAPDRASVLVNVQTRGATAAVAANENAQKTKAVLDALSKLGLSRDQLSTEGYTVYPEMRYDKDGQSPKVVAYVVTNTVHAETKRPDQAGAILDAAINAGANMINSLSFYRRLSTKLVARQSRRLWQVRGLMLRQWRVQPGAHWAR